MTMRGSVSSSKRKSSKKRNHKKSSSSKKKKSKGKELKKRRHDSVSSFSRDDSVNSDSSLSISDYRRKVKKSKRRRQRDYSISSCSEDDHSSDSMPRRDSARKNKKLTRTKTDSKSKMARKRYSSPESDGDARRVRKMKRKRSTGDRDDKRKKKSSTKKFKRALSPDSLSCSTCPSKSSSSAVDGKSERSKLINMEAEVTRDKDREVSYPYMSPVNNSSRLRSVISVAYQPDEDDRWDGNLRDEDMLHELDNYPSPIRLNGDEVGGKREVDNHSHHGVSNKKMKLEDVTAEEETKLGKYEIHVDPLAKKFEEKETNLSVPAPAAALVGDSNIELILRQKALENLRKFKAGRLQTAPQCTTNVKSNNENDGPNQPTKQATIHRAELTNQKSAVTFEKDSSPSEVEKHSKPEGLVVEEESGTVKQNNISSVSTSDNNNPGTPLTQSSITEPKSSAKPISGQHTLDKERDEGKDGPEFEQKTMSVMRGGEMVQVTYKVKIPKRAAALARRQLRR